MVEVDEPRGGTENPVDALLLEALERISAGEDGAVASLCAAHPESAEQIRERLDALRRVNLLPCDSGAMAFPERLGEFRLVRRLGGGGMGVVYEAVQEPLGRTVALKLIRPEHLYFERSRERFARETEAVARLAHPGIVTIYTVGEANGTPYFAMELVRGATLAQLLDQVAGLAPEALLGSDLRAAVLALDGRFDESESQVGSELFEGSWIDASARIALRVSEAMSHAHSRGVLHRDIKPSNITITPSGRVVLLDFGLAGLADESHLTKSGSALGSVLYMAPEQLEGRVADIDERTDVYALGVTLYEMLALQPPFAASDSTRTRGAVLDGAPPALRARHRGVPRDLEIVCLHAMQRDRSRRYPSMEAFGADLRNALAGRPISARPPSAAYRLRRWAARRPAIATAIGLGTLLVTVLPTALYLQQRANGVELQRLLDDATRAREAATKAGRIAELEAAESRQVADFLVQLLGASDPYGVGERDLSAGQMLDAAVLRIESGFEGQPELQARLYERVGETYTNLDRYTEALVPLDRALAMRRELHGDRDPRTVPARLLVGSAARLAGRADAEARLREAVEILAADPQSDIGLRIRAHSLLATCRMDAGDARGAVELLQRARDELQSPDGARVDQAAMVLALLARAQCAAGAPDEAESTARAALEADGRSPGASRAWELAAHETLAKALAARGRVEEAIEVYEAVLPMAREFHGASSTAAAWTALRYYALLQDHGRTRGFADELATVAATLRERLGDGHFATRDASIRAANALSIEGRNDEACALLAALVEQLARSEGDGAWVTMTVRYRLGVVQIASGDESSAIESMRRVREHASGGDEATRAAADIYLAYALLASREGVAEARELAAPWESFADHELSSFARLVLARAALEDGFELEAESALRGAFATSGEALTVGWVAAACRELRAELAVRRGELVPACHQLSDALAELERELGKTHADVLRARARLESTGVAGACGHDRIGAGESSPTAPARIRDGR